jgi:hypothetical protein
MKESLLANNNIKAIETWWSGKYETDVHSLLSSDTYVQTYSLLCLGLPWYVYLVNYLAHQQEEPYTEI